MLYLVLTSITSTVLYNGLVNYESKKKLKNSSAVLSFNFFIYMVCIIVLGMMVFTQTISLYTIASGLIFGVVTFLANAFKMLALTQGPMHLTVLFTTSSMIIPTLSGLFWGEKFSVTKFIMVIVLLFFLRLSFQKSNEAQISGKWFAFCLLAFLFQGALGVLQKIHQASQYRSESAGFLFVAFVCAAVFCLARSKCKFDPAVLKKSTILIGLLCGVCTFGMNYINLKLAGLLPSQLFFPIINGSTIILSSIMSIVLFKERLSKVQAVGLTGGIISLILIKIVN